MKSEQILTNILDGRMFSQPEKTGLTAPRSYLSVFSSKRKLSYIDGVPIKTQQNFNIGRAKFPNLPSERASHRENNSESPSNLQNYNLLNTSSPRNCSEKNISDSVDWNLSQTQRGPPKSKKSDSYTSRNPNHSNLLKYVQTPSKPHPNPLNLNTFSNSMIPTIKFPLERLNDDDYFSIIKKKKPILLANNSGLLGSHSGLLCNSYNKSVPKKPYMSNNQSTVNEPQSGRVCNPHKESSKKKKFLDLLINKDKKIYEIFGNLQSNKPLLQSLFAGLDQDQCRKYIRKKEMRNL
jgi:hypothetical protein